MVLNPLFNGLCRCKKCLAAPSVSGAQLVGQAVVKKLLGSLSKPIMISGHDETIFDADV